MRSSLLSILPRVTPREDHLGFKWRAEHNSSRSFSLSLVDRHADVGDSSCFNIGGVNGSTLGPDREHPLSPMLLFVYTSRFPLLALHSELMLVKSSISWSGATGQLKGRRLHMSSRVWIRNRKTRLRCTDGVVQESHKKPTSSEAMSELPQTAEA